MTVHVFGTMGTVVSLRYEDGSLDRPHLDAVEQVFQSYDQRFSLYDPTSPLSRIARGELTLMATDQSIRDAYALAVEWKSRTGGAFTPHRPDGVVDLSGVVKAQAIAEAGALLDRLTGAWLLTVGGDVLGRVRAGAPPWRIGIVDPADRDSLAGLAELVAPRRAIATSGTAERGQHLWRRGGEAFSQVTVVADDIVTADVLATAIAAGDEADLDRITRENDIDVLTFDPSGALRATPGARAWVTDVAAPRQHSAIAPRASQAASQREE